MTIPQIATITVALLACFWDLRTRRIPNLLTFGTAAAALVFHAIDGGASGVALSLTGWLLGIGLFLPLFAMGGLGAGDVKLLAAFGAWLGAGDVLGVALFSAIGGAVLAIVAAVSSGYARQAFTNIWSLLCFWKVMGFRPMPELTLEHAAGPRLAYAVPMLTGVMVKIWL